MLKSMDDVCLFAACTKFFTRKWVGFRGAESPWIGPAVSPLTTPLIIQEHPPNANWCATVEIDCRSCLVFHPPQNNVCGSYVSLDLHPCRGFENETYSTMSQAARPGELCRRSFSAARRQAGWIFRNDPRDAPAPAQGRRGFQPRCCAWTSAGLLNVTVTVSSAVTSPRRMTFSVSTSIQQETTSSPTRAPVTVTVVVVCVLDASDGGSNAADTAQVVVFKLVAAKSFDARHHSRPCGGGNVNRGWRKLVDPASRRSPR